jgi:hypothetical protein
MQQSSPSENACYFLGILDGESDAPITVTQERDKYMVTARPLIILRKPCPKITRPPQPPTPPKKRWLPDLDAFNLNQRNVPVATEGKVVTMKNDFFIGHFDETVFVNGAQGVGLMSR